ncbi:MAG TPA: TerB family tellurite resistance protein [Leptospiraceae bacterium]|nr:TerB family tellurite resistance protein [Leptospiraceae bacterium]HMW07893.1 TerB family tellurite resistance protein [Leptospiraceae bacterium]HMX33768.1 TerB family tellurite resistance protein [Leptospiraceae bacterium]HMY31156.1 TerB family tellurite resistance protein [Leptospiraceae bacterium]HMZ66661.1 TerB family tellurite resistance protein [Leptospiraceae bacterium]
MSQSQSNQNNPSKGAVGNSTGFNDYIRKVQKELSDDYLISVYISLYLRALRSDGVLNYEEKVWFADRVKELYDIDIFKPIQGRYTREEFMEHARQAASAPLDLNKIAAYFEKEKKQELCLELACFAVYTGDREVDPNEEKFLDTLTEVLKISESKKNEIKDRFKN